MSGDLPLAVKKAVGITDGAVVVAYRGLNIITLPVGEWHLSDCRAPRTIDLGKTGYRLFGCPDCFAAWFKTEDDQQVRLEMLYVQLSNAGVRT